MITIRVCSSLKAQVDAYRAKRFEETGKRPMRESAVRELLEKALVGVEPPVPVLERLADLETRISALEAIGARAAPLSPRFPVPPTMKPRGRSE